MSDQECSNCDYKYDTDDFDDFEEDNKFINCILEWNNTYKLKNFFIYMKIQIHLEPFLAFLYPQSFPLFLYLANILYYRLL